MRDIQTYNALMNACVKTRQLDKAMEVLDLLIEDKIAPNKVPVFLYFNHPRLYSQLF